MNLSELAPNPNNPRKITDKKLEMLKKSLGEFGDLSGIVFNKRTRRLVGGHQRIKVLPPDAEIRMDDGSHGHVIISGDRFSYREVDWDETKEKAANIAANKHGGEFELDLLKDWILDLDSKNIDLDLTGFDKGELDVLLAPIHKQGLTDEDAVPEKVEPRTKRGDLYRLGNHRLLCGDSTQITDVERLMGGEKADMVFTDPPYGVNYDGGHADEKRRQKLIGDENTDLYGPACEMAFKLSSEESGLYLWHAGVKGISAAAAAAAAAAGWEIRSELIWNKNMAQFGAIGAQYKQKHEPAYYCFKRGNKVNWAGPTNEVTVWDCSRASKNEFHPTQKPVELAERAIRNHSAKTVLDLFGGSGSTLIACEKTNRRCFMSEIDPHYCDVIVTRWEQFSGGKAELVADG